MFFYCLTRFSSFYFWKTAYFHENVIFGLKIFKKWPVSTKNTAILYIYFLTAVQRSHIYSHMLNFFLKIQLHIHISDKYMCCICTVPFFTLMPTPPFCSTHVWVFLYIFARLAPRVRRENNAISVFWEGQFKSDTYSR